MSEIELKSLAYEQIKILNTTQQNISLIEQEIGKRQSEKKEEVK